MLCLRCGSEVLDDSRFCQNCGALLNPQASGGDITSASQRKRRPAIVVASALGGAGLIAVVAALLILRPFAGSTNTPEPSPTPSPTTRATPTALSCEDERQPPGPADIFQKPVSVSVSLEGSPPPGYESSVPEMEVETALVMGTQDRVTLVTQAVATLDLSGHTEDFAQEVCLEPRDSRGFLIEEVSLEPSVVNVSVEITQAESSRALIVSPTVAGSPADGYNVVSVSAEPAVATVFGPESVVGDLATIRTQPVDIEGASGDVVRTVSLDLPADVSVSGGTSVTVTVKIEPAEGRRTLGITVAAVGLDPDMSISGALPLVEVVLLGELPLLQELRPNDVAATINLSGLGAGTHEIAVAVSVPAGASVAAVTPAKVSVTLERR